MLYDYTNGREKSICSQQQQLVDFDRIYVHEGYYGESPTDKKSMNSVVTLALL